MAKVAIALGSNLNEPYKQLKRAAKFLARISSQANKSSIFESEPIGPSNLDFLNAVILIETELPPDLLFYKLKDQEIRQGRSSHYPKWSARPIDMDIITYDKKIVKTQKLTIIHDFLLPY